MTLTFLPTAWDQYLYWHENDAKMFDRINDMIKDARRSPFRGLGKPEPLRGYRSGWWSRRIDGEHRLVYRIIGKGDEQRLEMAQCRFHY